MIWNVQNLVDTNTFLVIINIPSKNKLRLNKKLRFQVTRFSFISMNNLASFSNCENPINFIPINNLNLFDHFYLFPQFMFDKKNINSHFSYRRPSLIIVRIKTSTMYSPGVVALTVPQGSQPS